MTRAKKTKPKGARCNSCSHCDRVKLWCEVKNARRVLHNLACDNYAKRPSLKRPGHKGAKYKKHGIPGYHGKPKEETGIKCLKCDKEWFRPIGCIDRICPACHLSNERMGGSLANPEHYGYH